ncbi:MAG: hypothetical protein E7166_03810 [Firmicutes bacterium]|nr:hypothetical protein [Bacillota bacterium]
MFNGKKIIELRKKNNLTQKQLYALNTTPYYLLDAEKTIHVCDDKKVHNTFLSENDVKIINEIKKHDNFYHWLCENPKQVIEKIIKLLY